MDDFPLNNFILVVFQEINLLAQSLSTLKGTSHSWLMKIK
jgi:hypothetical protein